MKLDILYAWRQIRSNRIFSLIVISILSVGIGSNLLIFTLLDALLFTPLAVSDAGNLFLLEKLSKQQTRADFQFSYRQFREAATHRELFSDVVAEQLAARSNSYPTTSSDGGEVYLATTQLVSPNYFVVLGIRPLLGRVLTQSDATTAPLDIPAVISYRFWRTKLGANSGILGKHIRIKRFPFLVVGVLPQSFHSIDIDRTPDVRLPISAALPLLGRNIEDPRNYWQVPGFRLLARLRPGIMPNGAAEALLLGLRSTEEFEIRQRNGYLSRPMPPEVLSGEIQSSLAFKLRWLPASLGVSQLRERFSHGLKVLMGAVAVLLMLVCVNVTTLLLTRAEPRRKEMALRLALGASRGHLVRQLVTEYSLLMAVGAFAGIGLTEGMSPIVVSLLPPTRGLDHQLGAQLIEMHGDARVATFFVVTAFGAMIGSSVLPLRLAAAKHDVASELKGIRRGNSPSLLGILPVAIQVALSFLLALQGTLSLSNYLALARLNPGFEQGRIVSATVEFTEQSVSSSRKTSVLSEARGQISQIAGIRSVAYARWGLMRGSGFKFTAAPRGVILPESASLNVSLNHVSPSFFGTLGIPLVSGRNLTYDRGEGPTPIVVNQAFAKLLFPDQSPIGQYVVSGIDGTAAPTDVIVGVVANTKYRSMQERDPPIAYALLDEDSPQSVVMYVRSDNDPNSTIQSLRRVFRSLDPNIVITEVSTLEHEVQNSLWQERLMTVLLGAFSVIAILLAALGLYGALTFSINRRIHELGIRMAVGARPREIIAAASRRIGIGVGLGIVCGWAASSFWLSLSQPLLPVATSFSSSSFAAANVIILACAVTSAAGPLWRISSMDAADALKREG
jgi:predicted permease